MESSKKRLKCVKCGKKRYSKFFDYIDVLGIKIYFCSDHAILTTTFDKKRVQ